MGLSIFGFGRGTSRVKLVSEGGATLDTLVEGNQKTRIELRKLRAGHEAFDWDKSVDDTDEIDLEDIMAEDIPEAENGA